MKISYDPENIEGAERYLVKSGTVDAHGARAWLSEHTAEALSRAVSMKEPFLVVHRGLGFFYALDGYSTAPTFEHEAAVAGLLSKKSDASLNVTFWVAADVAA